MTIPLLGQQPSGVCIACKGPLTADHKHEYIDSKALNYLDAILSGLIQTGCIIPLEDGSFFPAHPELTGNFMWYPVQVTHTEGHEGCTLVFPHHHCNTAELITDEG